tara:strand:+ start:88 stop:489 length:402 start_codon:yes stop_codon:yes gene_type:complete
MGAGYDIPRAGLTSLVQNRKETIMSKEDEDKLNLDLSKYSTGSFDTITVAEWDKSVNGINASDMSITVDGSPLSSFNTDSLTTVTLKEVEFDFQNTDAITINTDVKQGDLFNGWPEDGAPDPTTITVTLNEEK